ncbi:MAG: recombinase family protein [Crocinitomicaceae bacterium]|nr:recombinase family protein [Crocinitomicaceae bacterium]MBK8926714.1 recombinase family protein [Crocinitomicaceae bacterium]
MSNKQLENFGQFAKKGIAFKTEGKTKAVIYTRVSTKEQADNNASLGTQKKYCELHAKKRNLTVVESFGGTFESAKSDDRKEFQKMLTYVKRHVDIAYIIVYSFDRFSRTGANGSYIVEQLKKRGIILLSATQEVDSTTSSGALQQDMFFTFSKFDNAIRRDKTVSGMQEKLRKGFVCGAIPFGYDNTNPGKGKYPNLVINKEGKLLQKAFELKAKTDLTYSEITKQLKKQGWKKGHKKLSDYFRNPIYCGIIVSSIIPGEVIEGSHPQIVSKEIFLKVNGLLNQKNYGGTYQKDDENLPLKQFIIADSCGTAYTGYLVRRKNIYYYKNNRIGSKENKSAKQMHELFLQTLKEYELTDIELKQPMKEMLIQVFIQMHEESIANALGLEKQVSALQMNLNKIGKRFALGEIDRELYLKYKEEFDKELTDLTDEIENSHFNLSNLENAIDIALGSAANLSEAWSSGDLEEKRRIQKMVFPEGIRYDHEKHVYRTPRVNSMFSAIPLIRSHWAENKNGKSSNFMNFSRLVPKKGIEPLLFRTRV